MAVAVGLRADAACQIEGGAMMAHRIAFLLLILLAAPLSAQDQLPPAPYAYTQLSDPAQEAEATALMQTLRCLKCQSQSIADSDAPMAGDMRHEVRARIEAGQTPYEIRAWLVERYGDYVSYQPEINTLIVHTDFIITTTICHVWSIEDLTINIWKSAIAVTVL